MFSIPSLCSLAALFFAVQRATAQCQVYGIDYVGGGSYFLNSADTEPFSLVQEFSGCQNDTANNILVNPNGDQTECSDTPLTPDYTPETVTCPNTIEGSMQSGDWSLLIISNNGDADPIAYERDFSITVGTQATTTVTPTVTVTDVVTAVVTQFSTQIDTITTTLTPKTSTKNVLINVDFTLTKLPLLPSIQQVTKTAFVVTRTQRVPNVATAISTAEASCAPPKPNWIADPIATIVANIISTRSTVVSAKFKRAIQQGKTVSDELKAEYVKERRVRLAEAAGVQKRSPDQPTVTVTDSVSSNFITSSTTTTAATTTASLTTTSYTTKTSTPPTVTVTKALLNLAVPSILGNLPALTLTNWVVGTTVTTQTVPWT